MLDTPPESGLDAITETAAALADVPVAALSMVDVDRQWFKSRRGTDLIETPREVAFCAHTIVERAPLIVPDATADERFSDNPLVTGAPGIRFYAGFPLFATNGQALGSLCAIDTKPGGLSEAQHRCLDALARHAEAFLEIRRTALGTTARSAQTQLTAAGLGDEAITTLDGMRQAQRMLEVTELDDDQSALLETVSRATEHLLFVLEAYRDDLRHHDQTWPIARLELP